MTQHDEGSTASRLDRLLANGPEADQERLRLLAETDQDAEDVPGLRPRVARSVATDGVWPDVIGQDDVRGVLDENVLAGEAGGDDAVTQQVSDTTRLELATTAEGLEAQALAALAPRQGERFDEVEELEESLVQHLHFYLNGWTWPRTINGLRYQLEEQPQSRPDSVVLTVSRPGSTSVLDVEFGVAVVRRDRPAPPRDPGDPT